MSNEHTLNLVAEDSSLPKFRGGATQAQTTFLCSFIRIKQHELILPALETATLADREKPLVAVRANDAEPDCKTIIFPPKRLGYKY